MNKTPLVLVVDDNAQNLKLADEVLRAAGLRTLVAASGAEAIELADRHRPDVILMDVGLPDMSGADAARLVRGRAATRSIPIIATSASRLDDDDWLVAAGFAGAITKPIDVAAFPDQVRGYCA